jgi:hypothetical protein
MPSFAARDTVELLLDEWRQSVVLPTGADFTAFHWPFFAPARCSPGRSGDERPGPLSMSSSGRARPSASIREVFFRRLLPSARINMKG